ncbi:MAG: phosphoribosylformylglycinamidine synthase subunit PurS [Rhodothermaceae bacterium]|nr:phosphoribosylformylglycinamidine synthase subunit PurS [Rhodothermaceae bacterium]
MYTAYITVTLRPAILDPQGKATHHALQSLGFNKINSVRIGKYMELQVAANTKEDAEVAVRSACEKLLANPVMEDYTVRVEPAM